MSASQRAQVAVTLTTLNEAGRPSLIAQICAINQSDAADLLNVSRRAVQQAKKVRDSGDKKLIAAVQSGEVTVSAAAQHVAAVQHDASIDASERWPCFKVVNFAATIARRSSAGDGGRSVMI